MQGVDLAIFIVFSVCFSGTVIFGHILGIYDKRREKDSEEEKEFYFGRKSVRFSLKEKKDFSLWEICPWAIVWCMVFLFCVAEASIEELRALFVGIGEKIDEFPGIMLSGFGAITMLGVLVGLKKDTWVGLSIDTIAKEHNITRKFKIMLLLVLMSYGCLIASVVLKNSTIHSKWYLGIKGVMFSVFVCYLYLFVKLLWALVDIMIGEKIAENRLKTLYQELWYSSFKKVECNGREELVKVLMNQYLRTARRMSFKDMKYKISFDTNVRMIKGKEERYNRLKVWSSIIVGAVYLLFFSAFVVLVNLQTILEQSDRLLVWFEIGGSIVIFLVVNVLFFSFSDGVKALAVCMVYGRHGYRFENQKKKGMPSRYVREVPIIGRNKYYKFVRATKNIIAFFLIYLQSGHDEVAKMVMKECEEKLKNSPKKYSECFILLAVMDYLYKREKRYFEYVDFTEVQLDYCYKVAEAFAIDVKSEYEGNRLKQNNFKKYFFGKCEQSLTKKDKKERYKKVKVQIKVYR